MFRQPIYFRDESEALYALLQNASDTGMARATGFCQVVRQTFKTVDTGLPVSDNAAWHWMSVAQCFAGPPEDPPAPGLRNPARQGDGHA